MDGVIVDSEPQHEQAFLEVFQELGYCDSHGIHFPDYYGRSDRALWVDFVAQHQPSQSLETSIQLKQDRLLARLQKTQPIFPGIPELIQSLATRVPLAVASGSSHPVIGVVLAMQDLRRHFPVVVSAQDVSRGKPDPDIFLLAAQKLGVKPELCVVIEDSVAGVTAARAAGMKVIAITNSVSADRLHEANAVVSNYNQIHPLLDLNAHLGGQH